MHTHSPAANDFAAASREPPAAAEWRDTRIWPVRTRKNRQKRDFQSSALAMNRTLRRRRSPSHRIAIGSRNEMWLLASTTDPSEGMRSRPVIVQRTNRHSGYTIQRPRTQTGSLEPDRLDELNADRRRPDGSTAHRARGASGTPIAGRRVPSEVPPVLARRRPPHRMIMTSLARHERVTRTPRPPAALVPVPVSGLHPGHKNK